MVVWNRVPMVATPNPGANFASTATATAATAIASSGAGILRVSRGDGAARANVASGNRELRRTRGPRACQKAASLPDEMFGQRPGLEAERVLDL